MFITYDPDTGAITGTIDGPGEAYGEVLTESGQAWICQHDILTLDPSANYVDPQARAIVSKPPMSVSIDRTRFQAGNDEGATISGVPSGAYATIVCGDDVQFSGFLDDAELKLTSAVAANYSVTISADRFLPWRCEVVAE